MSEPDPTDPPEPSSPNPRPQSSPPPSYPAPPPPPPPPAPLPSGLQSPARADQEQKTGIDGELGTRPDSTMAGLVVHFGWTAVSGLLAASGYSVSPRVGQGLSLAAGLDVRSASAPARILEGTTRLGVGIGGLATTAAMTSIETDLILGGSLIGGGLLGPPGAAVGFAIGMALPFLAGAAVSAGGNYAIDQAMIVTQRSMGAASNAIGSLQMAVYRLYGVVP